MELGHYNLLTTRLIVWAQVWSYSHLIGLAQSNDKKQGLLLKLVWASPNFCIKALKPYHTKYYATGGSQA